AAHAKESMFPPRGASGVRLSQGKARAGRGQGAAPVAGQRHSVFPVGICHLLGWAKGLRKRPKLTPSLQCPPTWTPPPSRAARAPGRGLKKCQGARTKMPPALA
ncbi:hypothetical protein KIL84_018400, partial [Mauremys mutica]